MEKAGGPVLAFTFNDLVQVPFVSEILEDNDTARVTYAHFKTLHAQLPQLIRDMAQQAEADCIEAILTGLTEAGLETIPEVKSKRKYQVCDHPLDMAVAFFTFPGAQKNDSRKAIPCNSQVVSYDKLFLQRQNTKLPQAWTTPVANPKDICAIAKLLAWFGFSANVTMKHMNHIARRISCEVCTGDTDVFTSWNDVVRVPRALSDHHY